MNKPLFDMVYENHVPHTDGAIARGNEWVLQGDVTATVYYDGQRCKIIDGNLYTIYNAKDGKTPPHGSIEAQPYKDPISGKWPHWRPVSSSDNDKWLVAAHLFSEKNCYMLNPKNEYIAVGDHFNNNPYDLSIDLLMDTKAEMIHELTVLEPSLNIIKCYFEMNKEVYAVLYTNLNGKEALVKRTDLGFSWPCKSTRHSWIL